MAGQKGSRGRRSYWRARVAVRRQRGSCVLGWRLLDGERQGERRAMELLAACTEENLAMGVRLGRGLVVSCRVGGDGPKEGRDRWNWWQTVVEVVELVDGCEAE